jgi:hypothetical protein
MTPGDYMRLHLQVPEYVGFGGVCKCAHRVAVAEDFNHLLHCQAAVREMTIRHDGMRSCLAKLNKKCVGVNGSLVEEATWEQRGELSSFTMDIVVKTDLEIEYLVDVTIINRGATSYMTDKLVEKGWVQAVSLGTQRSRVTQRRDLRRISVSLHSSDQSSILTPWRQRG